MWQKFLNFLKTFFKYKRNIPLVMENQSTLERSNVVLDGHIKISSNIKIQAYLFNIKTNNLIKSVISLNYPIVDVLELTPWGLIVLNDQYQLTNLSFLDNDLYLMNTSDFPCEIFKDENPIKVSPLAQIYDLASASKENVKCQIDYLKEKNLTYPVFDAKFLEKNSKFLSDSELFALFNQVNSSPIDSLSQSLDIFDTHLSSTQRLYGHRWSMGSKFYICESKLAELDRSEFSNFKDWENQICVWEPGQVALIQISGVVKLIEVLSVADNCFWYIDRQKACQLLQDQNSKESILLKNQEQVLIKDIYKFFIIKN